MGNRLPFSSRTVTVSGPALPELYGQSVFTLVRLEGREALCDLYEYEIELKQKSYGTVTYRVNATDLSRFGDPLSWTFESEDGEGRIVVRAMNRQTLQLRLEPPIDAGDQTVPSEASASHVRATMVFRQTGYEHQNSYNDDKVLASTLYSIVKIANTAPWWSK